MRDIMNGIDLKRAVPPQAARTDNTAIVSTVADLKGIAGDPSDNITSVFPKCGPKTALKYYENRELLAKKLQESELYQQKYELNKSLIDFDRIPKPLVEGFLEKWQKQLKYNL